MKGYRQSVILQVIDHEPITSQEQLRDRLRERGIETTQATLSRDIRDLGLVKRAADGAYRRAAAADAMPGPDASTVLRRAVEEYLRSDDAVDQLVVLRTDPAQAQPLAQAIDRVQLREVVGTIAGDDTILVICRSSADAAAFRDRLAKLRTIRAVNQ